MCKDLFGLPTVIVTSHPLFNTSPLN